MQDKMVKVIVKHIRQQTVSEYRLYNGNLVFRLGMFIIRHTIPEFLVSVKVFDCTSAKEDNSVLVSKFNNQGTNLSDTEIENLIHIRLR